MRPNQPKQGSDRRPEEREKHAKARSFVLTKRDADPLRETYLKTCKATQHTPWSRCVPSVCRKGRRVRPSTMEQTAGRESEAATERGKAPPPQPLCRRTLGGRQDAGGGAGAPLQPLLDTVAHALQPRCALCWT